MFYKIYKICIKEKIDFKLISKKALLFLLKRKYRIIKSFCRCCCYIVDCRIYDNCI